MGRKKMEGASLFQLRLTPDDKAYIRAVMVANGMNDMGSALRFAAREIVRRDRMRVDFDIPPAPSTEEEK